MYVRDNGFQIGQRRHSCRERILQEIGLEQNVFPTTHLGIIKIPSHQIKQQWEEIKGILSEKGY